MFKHKSLIGEFILLLVFPILALAQEESFYLTPQKPLRNFTVHIGIGMPVIFTASAELQTHKRFAIGVKYSRQWIKDPEGGKVLFLKPLAPQRFVHGTVIGITATYFVDINPQKFLWYDFPNLIRTEVGLVILTPARDIAPDREHAYGLSWEFVIGFELPYEGVGFYTDIGAILISIPGMLPVIGPDWKFGLAVNL